MDNDKIIERYLKLIRKKGDLYDTISQKRNATPETVNRKIVKYHTFVLSRLAYLLLVYSRSIKNKFAPVEKIKIAQDEIRKNIGVNVDVFRNKEWKRRIGILYGNYISTSGQSQGRLSLDFLLDDLRKILNFCSKYEINDIYIEKSFLTNFLSYEYLSDYSETSHSQILLYPDFSHPSYFLIKLNQEELDKIILKLEESKFDHNYIDYLKSKIKDTVVREAIDDFLYSIDEKKLLEIVKSRLNLLINSEGVRKDRIYGKLYESYEIGGPFIRVTTSDSEGNLISRNIISLYNYLETNSYSSLEKLLERNTDNLEINAISLLYLHLLGEKEKEERTDLKINSIYDFIYSEYKTTPFYKKIPWINTKFQKFKAEGPQIFFAFATVATYWALYYMGLFLPNRFLPIDNPFLKMHNKFFDKLNSIYQDSYEYEQNMAKSIMQVLEKIFPNKSEEEIRNYIDKEVSGDANSKNEDQVLAEIEWFTKEKMPVYFVDKKAEVATYIFGELEFRTSSHSILSYNLNDVRPMFQVKTSLSEDDINDAVMNERWRFPQKFEPAGDNYLLSQIVVQDEADLSKSLKMDAESFSTNRGKLTSSEKEMLRSMEQPMIYYIYGLSNDISEASFYSSHNLCYSKEEPEDIKGAIISGLGLDEDASDEEINAEIAKKSYTNIPLFEPDLRLPELEYYEKIASLEKVDINSAAVLTVMANDGFSYTVGYKNTDEDNFITSQEAYVWAMNDDGEIIDFMSNLIKIEKMTKTNKEDEESELTYQNNSEDTSSTTNEEKMDIEESEESIDVNIMEVLYKIWKWAVNHNIPYLIGAIIAVLVINSLFGKKIKLKLQLKNAHNILNSKDLPDTYADLLQFIYGVDSMPIKRSESKMVNLIGKRFISLSDEDIEDLLKEIKSQMPTSDDKASLKKVERLLKNIPFIIEHQKEIVEDSNKKLVLGGKGCKRK